MNSICDLCETPDDFLVQHPVNDSLMVCIQCYQDALAALLNTEGRGENETA